MTQKAAIGLALLKGEALSIMDAFQLFLCTNLPREISRSIEQEFDLVVSREKVIFKSKYGQPGFYYRYRLNKTEYNKPGIEKLKSYIKSHTPSSSEARTQKELNKAKQTELFLRNV